MSKKENVKQAIQELAMGNYNSYPEEYSIDTAPAETVENIESLARGYWDCRDDKEVVRDEKLGIHLNDYQSWAKEAFAAFAERERSLN
ncbi:hypothetical protein KTO58_17050 [Chitinophaga pendula]|uniref:hypothetical protein n=1 Tax=Chitinophaga TaxID=79328 RepID=UPI000BB0908D|nr:MULTISPECIES: hypothetical protein [Chitinophaga]ASZ11592.1 hypothetical protein CK934_11795 [Chitinophaga sp. MD30]UCJ05398.1 hypothetical protein KTO58_17050 [Chitinophaga pendula]